jgi:hypothetical protein
MSSYPRELTNDEKDLLLSVLPEHSSGYSVYRNAVSSMIALAEGRRGPGNLVLGYAGDSADVESPLATIVAYGMVETTRGTISITVRERLGDQVDVEIFHDVDRGSNGHYEEKRRWSYSSWVPGHPSPSTGQPVREVGIGTGHVLAIAPSDRRIWIWDRERTMNFLVPITNFYNEIMLTRGIRDPAVALKSSRLFTDLSSYTDDDLRMAFIAYNALRPKVRIDIPPPVQKKSGFMRSVRDLVRRRR